MSDWPPKPENETPKQQPVHEQPTGNEWKLLEKAVLASVEGSHMFPLERPEETVALIKTLIQENV